MKHLSSLLLTLCAAMICNAQPFILHGTVTDEAHAALIGATVRIADTTHGTLTNEAGEFTLTVEDSVVKIEIQYIGFTRHEQTIEAWRATEPLQIQMKEETATLDEVVIVGYGSTKKYSATGAISTVVRKGRGDSRRVARRTKKAMRSTADVIKKGDASYATASRADDAAYRSSDRPAAGQLTAGEIHDFSKWTLWGDLAEEEWTTYRTFWQMNPLERYAVQLVTEDQRPLIDAEVVLLDKGGKAMWHARTDNSGKAELWANLIEGEDQKAHRIQVSVNGKVYPINSIQEFHDGLNVLTVPQPYAPPLAVDMAFVVDATGSMGDEIAYLKFELLDVIARIQDRLPNQPIRLGSVFYRDTKDEYLTRHSDFSRDVSQTTHFIQQQTADGGGDKPEAMDRGLEVAIEDLTWSQTAAARLLFLVLDAPPHGDSAKVKARLKNLTKQAAQRGIRIIPLTGSGIDKSTEYLMRSLALATNGTYTFLTDHSGIGESHIEPTTDTYKVELLNDLLTRLTVQFARVSQDIAKVEAVSDTVNIAQGTADVAANGPTGPPSWRCYPNPTEGELWVEVEGPAKAVYLADMSGKLLLRQPIKTVRRTRLDLTPLPVGTYLLRIEWEEGKWVTGRVIRR